MKSLKWKLVSDFVSSSDFYRGLSRIGFVHVAADPTKDITTPSTLTVGTVFEGDIPSSTTSTECTNVEDENETEERETSGRSREERKLAIMMMNKKRKYLFDRIMKSRKKKGKEVRELKRKRKEYEESLEQDSSKRAKVT